MNESVPTWRHVFKLDPERELGDYALERLCLSGTDGIVVGGSTGVTYENTADLLARVRRFEIPCALEVSAIEAIVAGFDLYLIPVVLNTRNTDWMIGHHRQAIRDLGSVMPWERILAEGYLILNPDSAAARVAEARPVDSAGDAIAYAQFADRLMRMPIVYLEYSGVYGDMELVRRIRSELGGARLWYGGGIDGRTRAAEALEAADTIVVGNLIYDDLEASLLTVDAACANKYANG